MVSAFAVIEMTTLNLPVIILGITGGIATGKSTVTQMFADLGAPTASGDAIAREVLEPGTPQTAEVAAAFPSAVASVDPVTLDRRVLASIIFADDFARNRLEEILHPPITDELRRRIAEFRTLSGVPMAAVEVPLLFEAGLTSMVDKIVVVTVDEETQVARLQERLKIDRAAAEQQLQSQWPLSRKVEAADYVVDAGVSIETMRSLVQTIWSQLSSI